MPREETYEADIKEDYKMNTLIRALRALDILITLFMVGGVIIMLMVVYNAVV